MLIKLADKLGASMSRVQGMAIRVLADREGITVSPEEISAHVATTPPPETDA